MDAIDDDWLETGKEVELASDVEPEIKDLAILLARIRHPSKVKENDNSPSAPWRQWVHYARIILAAGYGKAS